jgi:tripeptide aminopeptidase
MAMDHSTAGQSRQDQGASYLSRPGVKEAWAFLQSIDAWILDRQMEITAIPAPPFEEEARGRRMAELFGEAGLRDVRTDEVGNVLGELGMEGDRASKVSSAGRPFVVSAHLDTVFPPGTDVTPKREGDRIKAPGISDDGRGLAALLALARVLMEIHLPLPFPLLFVATVGEEGPGDLRGTRHLLANANPGLLPIGFISLDGAGLDRIINYGVGSTRLRISVKGPGGHSWTGFGRPNPIHVLGRIVARAQALALSPDPKTTLTVARWGGGNSINSIPQEAWVEVDLRSEAGPELEALEESLLRVCREEVGERTHKAPHSHEAPLEVQEIGRRPAGSTEPSEPLVSAALEATRILGEEPNLISSSTDANIPMSLGIPAITLGAGGSGGGIHTLEEWYHNRKGPEGILRALLTLLLHG